MRNARLLIVALTLVLGGCDNPSSEVGPEQGPSGETADVQRGMSAESLETPSKTKEIDAKTIAESEARSAELATKLPDDLPFPGNAKINTLVNHERRAWFIIALLPDAESQEAVFAFYRERLPQLGWQVGEDNSQLTFDPSLSFENDKHSGLVNVYELEGQPGFLVQIETRAKLTIESIGGT